MLSKDRRSRAYYDLIACIYDRMMRVSSWLDDVDEFSERRRLVSHLVLTANQHILAVGVGTGSNLPFIAPVVGGDGLILGIDISMGMLRQCREKMRRLGIKAMLVQANASAIPIPNERFDAVLHFGGLNAFEDTREAVQQMLRVARRGGTIVISDKSLGESKRLAVRDRLLLRLKPELAAPPPIGLLGLNQKHFTLDWLWGGRFYVLRISKP